MVFELECVLVRYGEIGTKSDQVRGKMVKQLRQRVEDKLSFDEVKFEKVSVEPGRVKVETPEAREAALAASEVPGVVSSSPAVRTDARMEALEKASEQFSYGDTFAVRTKRTGEHEFSSQEVNEEVGSHVEGFTGASVDLDDPGTELGIEIRFGDAYVFSERYRGPGGYPVGSQEPVAALISGGIDSPVAAYQVMKRGAPVVPVYFYNKPVAAEDHWLRFKASVQKLKRYHPSVKWEVYRVDMESVNEKLVEFDRGRMLLHRSVMFRVAEAIAEIENLEGIVTGESLGQKSTQTASNLRLTTREIETVIHRPLLTWNKNSISEKAREIGTFSEAKIDSACRSISPDNPATSMEIGEFERLKEEAGIQNLAEEALDAAEKIRL